jgi:thiaminase/transcriptional activator TenA
MAPTTRAYTDFLVRTAATGEFAELCAALLPCMWAFSEIGASLAKRPPPANPRFASWIGSYASEDFAALANWCRDLVDRLAAEAPGPVQERMEVAFVMSSRYELAFWEMAWQRERWI